MKSYRIDIFGQVQGLGFRPYVYRLAVEMGVRGMVMNSPAGVTVLVQGAQAQAFCDRLRRNPPSLAEIAGFEVAEVSAPARADFRIVASERTANHRSGAAGRPGQRVNVLPDIATCPDCRHELFCPGDRRRGYAFTNCTQCGPRYSIIQTLPYDRPGTTMAGFRLCPDCAREYSDPLDRRFHAQPNACPACGPAVTLLDARGQPIPGSVRDPIAAAARAVLAGKIVAVRSLGGFQLACDATNRATVARLRRRKTRPAKPLALMVEDAATAGQFCRVGRAGRELLTAAAAPIVLLSKLPAPKLRLADNLAPGNARLGVMLAYTPLHLLLFARLRAEMRLQASCAGRRSEHDRASKRSLSPQESARQTNGGRIAPPVLVMTSANRREEAIIGAEEELVRELGGVFDLALSHNRPIANRCDDSVVLADRAPVIIRRARGYAPRPVRLRSGFHVKHPVLALGGDMQNCFCLAAGDQAWLSPHLGNPGSASTERLLRETLARYQDWTGVRPTRLACDLHPDYASTRLAETMSRELGLPLFRVQHHCAHAFSALAPEAATGCPGARDAGALPAASLPALGLCFDGTGYGTDGAIWGCEFLLVRPDRSWHRAGHLEYLRLPAAGGALADPARVAAAYLRQCRGRARTARQEKPADAACRYGTRRRGYVRAPWTSAPGSGILCSSLGRLFDAMAAIAGVKRHVSFEGEAAIALEACLSAPKPAPGTGAHGLPRPAGATLTDMRTQTGYRFPVSTRPDGTIVIDPTPALLAAAADVRPGRVAARFHSGFARSAVATARRIASLHGVELVVLAGGSFQNSFLRNYIARRLRAAGLLVRHSSLVPVNDGAVSLGQAVAAGGRRPDNR